MTFNPKHKGARTSVQGAQRLSLMRVVISNYRGTGNENF